MEDNIWIKKRKGCLKITKFNDYHINYECHLLASKFILILQKLSKKILEKIQFLNIVVKVNATV